MCVRRRHQGVALLTLADALPLREARTCNASSACFAAVVYHARACPMAMCLRCAVGSHDGGLAAAALSVAF